MAIERHTDGTIHTPGNLPTELPRQPQLGDTREYHGGLPATSADAPVLGESRPKGLDEDGSGSAIGGLGSDYGGHSRAPCTSPEKNILQTDESDEYSNSDMTEAAPQPGHVTDEGVETEPDSQDSQGVNATDAIPGAPDEARDTDEGEDEVQP